MALVDDPMSPRSISAAKIQDFDFLIFDYGGVLVNPQPASDQAAMAKIVNLPVEQFQDLYWRKRLDYDKAALTSDDYWNDLAEQAGTKLDRQSIQQLIRLDTTGWMHYDEVMWNWLAELRQLGKRLAILSNMPRELGEALKSETGRLTAFDFVTLSYELRIVKPDAAIYQHTLKGLGAKADRTLFFDDKIENVRGAEQVGIRAIQFLDRDQVLDQLKNPKV